MAEEITLFDLASKDHKSWSGNTLKTRLYLNYIGVPYKTVWLEYPEIESNHKALGISPHDPSTAAITPYTVPAVQFPDGKCVMESAAIALELNNRYQQADLIIADEMLSTLQRVIRGGVMINLSFACLFLPGISTNLLNPPSEEYTAARCRKWFGKSVEDLAKDSDPEKGWGAVEPHLKELGQLLKEKDGGPFLLGEKVSYADFVIVALLQFLKRIDEALYEQTVKIEPALQTLYDASMQWLVRDDH